MLHSRDRRQLASLIFLALVLAAAIGFRVYLGASTDFPIADGGLFLVFVESVSRTFPGLPAFVSYNGLAIPFAYPPLSFWVGALLVKLGMNPLDVVHFVPLWVNALYVALLAALLLRSGRTPFFTALALLFFCMRARSFEWLVMGGGLSRGMGALFFILALLALASPRREPPPRAQIILSGLFVGASILSHLEWGLLSAGTIVLAIALKSRSLKEAAINLFTAGAVASMTILPWLGAVCRVHGFGPLLAAGSSASWTLERVWSVIRFLVDTPIYRNPFIILGLIVAVRRRELFWPLFILVCTFLTPRHAPTPLMIPLGILGAQGVIAAFQFAEKRVGTLLAAGALAGIVALMVCFNIYKDAKSARTLHPVTPEARRAMAWVRANHPGERFAVVTENHWWYDISAEWFPVLAQAVSVTTVQGREWLPNQAFTKAYELSEASKKQNLPCADLLNSLEPFGSADFVWAETRRECFVSPAYREIFRNGKVVILQRSTPAHGGG